ncbi:MAG TPA: Gfo/Idh/MocA family oxidoreductase [Planctomycetes bacterium]|nr:Gfo/Idh/MocA family oxidoreductase [Planctomycetota bacterium]
MSNPLIDLSRRRLLQATSAATALALSGCRTTGARRTTSGKLRHAGIGVGGQGAGDLAQIAAHPEVEVAALCDVDRGHLEKAAELYPEARLYRDWRELFREEEGRIDSVHVTIPDHMHAPVITEALARRLHVYGQKPLTRTVAEARAIANLASRARVWTQMGIQNHSNTPYAQALALFRQGHIGKVYEAHVWTDRPHGWWPQGCDRPEGEDEVPEELDWELWLGVAPYRPYKKGSYHPFAWRGWRDFGTGAQGDMGCHLMDPAVWFLELGHPLTLRSDGPAPNAETYPEWSRVEYQFAPTRHTIESGLRLVWHDGGKKVWRELLDEIGAPEKVYDNACLFLGTNGALLASPYEVPLLFPKERFEVEVPEVETENHWHQWVNACLGMGATSAPFEYSTHLTEIVLLGNVALSYPHETLEWDGRRLVFPNRPEAGELLLPHYREEWS